MFEIIESYRDKAVSLRATSFRIHHQLHVLNLAERLENASQHVLCDVKVQ